MNREISYFAVSIAFRNADISLLIIILLFQVDLAFDKLSCLLLNTQVLLTNLSRLYKS